MLLAKVQANDLKCVRKLSNSRSIAVVEHDGRQFLFLYGRKSVKKCGARVRSILAFFPPVPAEAAAGSPGEGDHPALFR